MATRLWCLFGKCFENRSHKEIHRQSKKPTTKRPRSKKNINNGSKNMGCLMIELLEEMYGKSPLKAGYGERKEVYDDTHMNVGARLIVTTGALANIKWV